MNQMLFKPKKIQVADRLVLVPQFFDRDGFQQLKRDARKVVRLLESELLFAQDYTLLSGFIGYPNLLTLLAFIEDIERKDIFFLGTAGSLRDDRNNVETLNVSRVFASSLFKRFSGKDRLDMLPLDTGGFQKANVVSVDLVQRETRRWLIEQHKRGMDAVEMELFPLRVFLGRPFYALVILSDHVSANGIIPFDDKDRFRAEFRRSFDFIRLFFSREGGSRVADRKIK